MALKPVLKIKVDELFLRWLSDSDVQRSLRDSLVQIAKGESVSAASKVSIAGKGNSPRGNASSFVTPTSPKLPSPSSPRRSIHGKKNVVGMMGVEAAKPVPALSIKDKEGDSKSPAPTVQPVFRQVPDILPHRPASTGVAGSTPSQDVLLQQVNEGYPRAALQQHRADLVSPVTEVSGQLSRTKTDSLDNKAKIHIKSSFHIPQFYFPSGKPTAGLDLESVLQKVAQSFIGLEGGKAYKQQMASITKAASLPLFWKILLFRAAGGASEGFVTYQSVSAVVRKLHQFCHDDSSKFMKLVARPGSTALEFEDFEPLIQDVVETHPGLTFLQDAPEFHSRYVTTVISRIMFSVNRSWTGRITLPELRRSNFLQTVARLEQEEDINQVKDFFSYEHFYVIYCKFWELDKDHDLYIDKNDLARHNDHALNTRLVERIFSGAVTRGQDLQEARMSYKEFVWFLLAEEDKKHPTSIEYWFRCMDLNGDGVVSMYEMEYFHEEQMNKMETLGIERLPFEDTVCQMMDMVSPKIEGKITLSDLKACKMTNIFFDTFFNLEKFLEHEQRDPFANAKDLAAGAEDVSDWDKYAEEEYDILIADEGNPDIEEGNYEDDFEPEDDEELVRGELLRLADSSLPQRTTSSVHASEDIYDFSNTANLGY